MKLRCICLALGLLNLLPNLRAETWNWVHEPGQFLELRGSGNEVVCRLNFNPEQTKPYFHPLNFNGRTLTWINPKDHVWHYGLWHSWKSINGVNYWEERPQPAGVTRIESSEVLKADGGEGVVQLQLILHPRGKDDQPVARETVRIRVETPRADGSYRIDWTRATTALADEVTFDRTPIPGEPGGRRHGGYAGLTFRAAKSLENAAFLASTGQTGMDFHRQTARWADLSGEIDGQPCGLAILDHPSNLRHPTPWFLVERARTPFFCLNVAPICLEPLTLSQGQEVVLRYRILVHPGSGSAEVVEKEYADFVASDRPRTSPR